MSRILVFSIFLSVLAACGTPESTATNDAAEKPDTVAALSHVPFAATQVYDTVSRLDYANEQIGDKLFGSFYEDRATYYVIPNPDRKLYGQSVDRMVLYYLDSEMLKVQYSLSEDIVHQLIRDYGKFRLKALDSASQVLLENNRFWVQNEGGIKLSDSLSAYRLTWEIGDKQLVYEAKKDREPPVFEFVEKSTAYDDFLLAVKLETQF